MVRYNKVNPFKKLKDKKSYQFIIDRSSRFHLQANEMVSIFNGDTLVNYNKKSRTIIWTEVINEESNLNDLLLTNIIYFASN